MASSSASTPRTPKEKTPEKALAELFGPKLRNLTYTKLKEFALTHRLATTESEVNALRWTDPEGRAWDLRSRLLFWLLERGSPYPISNGSAAILKRAVQRPLSQQVSAQAQNSGLWVVVGRLLMPTGLMMPSPSLPSLEAWSSRWSRPFSQSLAQPFSIDEQATTVERWAGWLQALEGLLPCSRLELFYCAIADLEGSLNRHAERRSDVAMVFDVSRTDWAGAGARLASLFLPSSAAETEALLVRSAPFADYAGHRSAWSQHSLALFVQAAPTVDRQSWQPFLDTVLAKSFSDVPVWIANTAVALAVADLLATGPAHRGSALDRLEAFAATLHNTAGVSDGARDASEVFQSAWNRLDGTQVALDALATSGIREARLEHRLAKNLPIEAPDPTRRHRI